MRTMDKWKEEFKRLKNTWSERGGWNMGYDGHDMDRIEAFIEKVIQEAIQADRKRLAEKITHLRDLYEASGNLIPSHREKVSAFDKVLEIINSNFLKE